MKCGDRHHLRIDAFQPPSPDPGYYCHQNIPTLKGKFRAIGEKCSVDKGQAGEIDFSQKMILLKKYDLFGRF
jgi:hypothetical protein